MGWRSRPADIAWFPERTWDGRTYVPATAPAGGGEVFGYVSYTREHEGAQAADFTAIGRLHRGDRRAEPRLDARPLRRGDRPVARHRGPARRDHARLGRGARAERRGRDHRARAHHHRPVRAGRRPLHAASRSTPTRATTSRSASTARAEPSWPASRCTRTSSTVRFPSTMDRPQRCVLLKFGELALKGRNRPRFVGALERNLRRADGRPRAARGAPPRRRLHRHRRRPAGRAGRALPRASRA